MGFSPSCLPRLGMCMQAGPILFDVIACALTSSSPGQRNCLSVLKCMQVAPSCLALSACASTSSSPSNKLLKRLQMYASCPISLALIACAGSKSRSPCDVLVLHQKSFSRAPRHSKGRRTPWQSIPPERNHRTRLERGAWQAVEATRGVPCANSSRRKQILRENKVHQERRARRGSKQRTHQPGVGSGGEKKRPGEGDLQDDARLVVKMKMGSCGREAWVMGCR